MDGLGRKRAALNAFREVESALTNEVLLQAEVIKVRNARLANRIQLHLALGGGWDDRPAAGTAPPGPLSAAGSP
jgi:outer membrane protein TolC